MSEKFGFCGINDILPSSKETCASGDLRAAFSGCQNGPATSSNNPFAFCRGQLLPVRPKSLQRFEVEIVGSGHRTRR